MPSPSALPCLVVVLLLSACAEASWRLPRLRARGWVTVTGPAMNVGGEVGLVMPLDPAFATAGDAPPDELDEPEPTVRLVRRAAPCRVPAACGWERMEGARALARLEEGAP